MIPVPEVMESVTVPDEECPAPAEPEPEVESKPEPVDTEPPIAKPVEIDAIPDAEEVEPVVSHDFGSLPTSTVLNSRFFHPACGREESNRGWIPSHSSIG